MASTKSALERFLHHLLSRKRQLSQSRCATKPHEWQRRYSVLASKNQLGAETILTTKNRESCVRRLKLYPAMKMVEDARTAAVLVPLCNHNGELGFLYTLRSTKLSSNKGQVSFPGGMKDDADESLEATALRETWEELRIPESRVDVWSKTNFIGRKDLNVMPVFGYIGDVEPEKLTINRDEVEEAFVVSLEKLCDPRHFRYTQFRRGVRLPVFTGGKYRVWGLTAAITHLMMKALVPDAYKNHLEMSWNEGRKMRLAANSGDSVDRHSTI